MTAPPRVPDKAVERARKIIERCARNDIWLNPAERADSLLSALTAAGLTLRAEGEVERWGDKPLPEDAAIMADHPMNVPPEDTRAASDRYGEAMRLVGARHSKHALVDLVNWLLARIARETAARAALGGKNEDQ